MASVYLLKTESGHPLAIVAAPSQAEADAFGLDHFSAYCGRSVEIDPDSRREAEQFWRVPSIAIGLEESPAARPARPSRPFHFQNAFYCRN